MGSRAAAARTWQLPGFAGRMGCARGDITPPLGIRARNWGASSQDRATGIHRPLTVTVLALAGADDSARMLVTADLGWWRSAADEWAVRSRVLAELDLDPGDLLVHLVHTHAGPTLSTAEAHLEGGELIGPYLDRLADGIVAAARAALKSMTPAIAVWAQGKCTLAVNRDLRWNGRDVTAFDPDAAADDTLLVGRISRHDGSTLATLVNYACHPTTLGWQSSALSPDWPGAARGVVEAATGAPCLILQGASGELSPREQYSADTRLADRNGRAVGYAALSTIDTMPAPCRGLGLERIVESGATLGIWEPRPAVAPSAFHSRQFTVQIPARKPELAAELKARWGQIDERAAEERVRRALQLRSGYVADTGMAAHPVWLWRLGDAAIVAHPGEAYSLLQTELRQRHPQTAIMVLNCTNGPGFVYLPPRETYGRDVYQAWQTVLQPGCLEAVLAACDDALALGTP